LTKEKNDLERNCSSLQAWIDTHSLILEKYLQLEDMGFGLKVQKLLWCKREIGIANQKNPDEAVQKFMKDMELYDDKLGFKPELNDFKVGIQKTEPMDNILMMAMVVISYLISILAAHLDGIQRIEEFRPLLKQAKGEIVMDLP
jgi:hypothetical protein